MLATYRSGQTLNADQVQPQRIRDSSVTISSDWQMLEEIDFARLLKLSLTVAAPEDM